MPDRDKYDLHPSLPEITGPHRQFALRFRKALRYGGLMGYTPETGKFGSYGKAEEKLPYRRQMIGEVYRGEKLPERDKYEPIAKACKVNYVWLRDGTGSMVDSGDDYNTLMTRLPDSVREAVDAILEPYRGKTE